MSIRRFATGLITLLIAWLCMSQASLVYAQTAPATTSTGTTTTTTPGTTSTTSPTSTSPTSTAPILPGGNGDSDPSSYTKPSCSGGGLGWIVCPLINAGVETVAKISKLVIDMLETKPLTQDSGLYEAWKAIRNLADVMFILIFLALIFGNMVSSEGSYALKSLLPKLIIAAIGVQVSFFVTAFIIDIGNVSGAGIGSIMSQLGTTAGTSQDITHGIFNVGSIITFGIAGLTAVIAGVILTWPAILLMLGGFIISVLGVFFTLALRQLIIAVLIVLSPLAFAAWVLPNTEVYFKQWVKNMVRVILVYPLIVILLSIGGFLARVASETDGIFGSHEINVIFASLIPILVFLAIPATFKIASGIMGTVSGRVFGSQDRAKGFLGGQLKKDIKESRQEKGFIAQRDASHKWERALGRARAGQPGLGQPGRRRLAKGYDAAIGAQMKDWGIRFDDLGLSNDDLMKKVVLAGHGNDFIYTGLDGRTKKEKITKAMQAQAIGQIAKQGGNVELNKIHAQIFDPTRDNYKGEYIAGLGLPTGNESADTWFRGMGSSGVMPQAIQAIPMLNPGKKHVAYDGLSASQVASIHGSGADKYFNRIMAPVGTDANPADVAAGKKDRVSKALSNFRTIASSADQRSKVDQQLVAYFKDKVRTDNEFHNILAAESIRFDNRDMTGVDFFNDYIADTGKIEHQGLPGTP